MFSNLIRKLTSRSKPEPVIWSIHFVRDHNWVPVELVREYDVHDFFDMYHWGRENISSPIWAKAMEKTFTHMNDIKYHKKLRKWVLYFPTEEDAMAFKLAWL